MKKVFLIALLFIFIAMPALAQWNDCPYGEIDCGGLCSQLIDTDNDGICDHSQLAPEDRTDVIAVANTTESVDHDPVTGQELKTKTVRQVADVYEIDAQVFADTLGNFYNVTIKPTDNFQLLHDNYGLEPSVAKDIALGLSLGNEQIASEVQKNDTQGRRYVFFPVAIILIIAYLTTHILSRKKVISVVNHRKFWNILLTITFLGVGLSGIFLILRINLGLNIRWPFNMLYWHVETGLAMTLISIFHILWHLPYYKNILKFK